jgi:dolichyl-phosphate-mannose-protein mannosyltransferase
VYWGGTASLPILGLVIVWYLIRWQRGYNELKPAEIDHIHYAGLYPMIGWVLHYLPFIIMARVTYVHHYYPALYFSILTAGFCVDWFTRSAPKAVQSVVYGVLYAVIIGLFILFKDICFGMEGDNKQWAYLRWFNTWRITDPV